MPHDAGGLNVFWGDGEPPDRGSGLSPRMTLPRFFFQWFDPVVLEGERDAAASTRLLWRDTIGYWERLTPNPPLAACDGNDQLLAAFCTAMRKATYRRSKCPGAREYPLAPHTIRRHILNAQWLLAAAQKKGLISEAPRSKQKRVRPRTKPAFDAAQIATIFEAIPKLPRPTGLPCSTADFWRGLLATALITGVRKGTYFALEWSWVVERADGWWIEFPDHSVPKTDRGVHVALPDWLRRHLFRWPRISAKIFDNAGGKGGVPWSLSHWDECHDELQRLASIAKPLCFQAWRRTLGQEMIRFGLRDARKIAQAGLDHRNEQTTEDFYTAAAQSFRRSYPPLFYVPPDDGQMLLFV